MSKEIPEKAEFGYWRSFFWPIYNFEIKKFLPMGLMMFFILFNYTLLRGSKDALVQSVGGASIIPFLKGYLVLPMAILFVMVYSKLLEKYSRERVFYMVVSFFIVFYSIFAIVIYPNLEFFHPADATILEWKAAYPTWQHFISIAGNWSFSLYYVFAEIWGSAMVSLLFWQFANQITRTSEAKRFYAMFSLIANFALILAGVVGRGFTSYAVTLASEGESPYAYSNLMICGSVVLAACAVMYLYRWIHSNVLTDPLLYTPKSEDDQPKKKKPKLSVLESFRLLFTNKYLLMIAMLVLAYGISMNLIELMWKNQLNMAYPTKNEYTAFMSNQAAILGTVTILVILFSKGIVQRFGWFWGAIATPIVMLITGMGFFACIFFSGIMDPIAAAVGTTSLMMGVIIGTAQNVLSKGVKYSLFDPTKEMSYIPLDKELQTRGKAAVDVVGGRLGKASGGYIASILMMVTAGTIADISFTLAGIVALVIGLWVVSVFVLNSLYHKKLAENETNQTQEAA